MKKSKGIFCIEGDWWNNLKQHASVEPILSLLAKWDPYFVPYIHRDVGTRDAFDLYMRKWLQRGHGKYPILYLSFHGEQRTICIGDMRIARNRVTLDDLEKLLEGKCARRIIYFGCCDTLDVHGTSLNGFLRRTGALAVCGYIADVDWLEATAFEVLVFGAMQENAFTRSGARAMKRRIYSQAKSLAKKLKFRMVVRA